MVGEINGDFAGVAFDHERNNFGIVHRHNRDGHLGLEISLEDNLVIVLLDRGRDRPGILDGLARNKRSRLGQLPRGDADRAFECVVLRRGDAHIIGALRDIREEGNPAGVGLVRGDGSAGERVKERDQGVGDVRGAGDVEGVFVLHRDLQVAHGRGNRAERERHDHAAAGGAKEDIPVVKLQGEIEVRCQGKGDAIAFRRV